MKFSARSKPWKSAAKDAGRYRLSEARLCEIREVRVSEHGSPIPDNLPPRRIGTLATTNGKILAVQTVEIEDGDTEGYVSLAALQRAAKVKRPKWSSDGLRLSCNGAHVTEDEVSSPRPNEDDKPGEGFPRFRAVMPDFTAEKAIRVRLNPKLLLELAESLGMPEEMPAVELVILPSTLDPKFPGPMGVEVEGNDPTVAIERRGILMPITREAR